MGHHKIMQFFNFQFFLSYYILSPWLMRKKTQFCPFFGVPDSFKVLWRLVRGHVDGEVPSTCTWFASIGENNNFTVGGWLLQSYGNIFGKVLKILKKIYFHSFFLFIVPRLPNLWRTRYFYFYERNFNLIFFGF